MTITKRILLIVYCKHGYFFFLGGGGGKFHKNVGKTFHIGVIFMIFLLFPYYGLGLCPHYVLWVLFPRGRNFREKGHLAKNAKITPNLKKKKNYAHAQIYTSRVNYMCVPGIIKFKGIYTSCVAVHLSLKNGFICLVTHVYCDNYWQKKLPMKFFQFQVDFIDILTLILTFVLKNFSWFLLLLKKIVLRSNLFLTLFSYAKLYHCQEMAGSHYNILFYHSII